VPDPGTVAMLSGLIVSTALLLLLEAVSPVDEVTFFPQPVNGTRMTKDRSTVATMRGIIHFGIAHLSL
jgi:hypothetical protein